VSEAVGVIHPGLLTPDDIDVLYGVRSARSLRDLYGYAEGDGALGARWTEQITALMAGEAPTTERSPSR
jgi:hypothetical protein